MLTRRTIGRFCLALSLGAAMAASGPGPARAETITVTHWGGQFYGAPYAVAIEKGFFRQHGVDVTGILTAAGGGTAVRNTLAGGIPFGEVSLASAVQAINAGRSSSSSPLVRRAWRISSGWCGRIRRCAA